MKRTIMILAALLLRPLTLTAAQPMNAASSRSLAMTTSPAEKPEGRVALTNSGYWGINVQTGRTTVKARRTGGNEGFLMFFHASGPERYMFCNYGAAGNHFSTIQGTPAEGLTTKGGGDIQGPIEKDRWYDISLVVTKSSAEMFLDAKRVSRIEAEALPTFFATAGCQRNQKTAVVRAANCRDVPVPVTIELAGTQSIGSTGD